VGIDRMIKKVVPRGGGIKLWVKPQMMRGRWVGKDNIGKKKREGRKHPSYKLKI
jgi:hypothetical protein